MTAARSSAAVKSPNASSAVRQQRHEAHDSLDDFPTPPWATRALLARVFGDGLLPLIAREPAANRGHMVRPLAERFGYVEASDIHDYGAGFEQRDYLFGPEPDPVDWTITNPPFRLAEQFIARALATSRVGVAIIVRSAFTEGAGRYALIFSKTPPSQILYFAERVVMHRGHLPNPNVSIESIDPKTGLMVKKKPSTPTAYCWMVWYQKWNECFCETDWIAPCRARFEVDGDYPADGIARIGGAS